MSQAEAKAKRKMALGVYCWESSLYFESDFFLDRAKIGR